MEKLTLFESHQYVDFSKQTEDWYQLSVINQWDWTTKTVCLKRLSDDHLISYTLNRYSAVDEKRCRRVPEEIVPDYIKQELVERGYTLSLNI